MTPCRISNSHLQSNFQLEMNKKSDLNRCKCNRGGCAACDPGVRAVHARLPPDTRHPAPHSLEKKSNFGISFYIKKYTYLIF